MKFIMSTIPMKLCEKIGTKRRRRRKELDRINEWHEAPTAMASQASRQESQSLIKKLDQEIEFIQSLRERRYRTFAPEVCPEIPSIDGTRNALGDGSTIHDDAIPTIVSHYLSSLYGLTAKAAT